MTKTVLITNGRFVATLDLIRNFSKNGIKVIVAETTRFHYCSFSRANSKNVLIPSPRECEEGYIQKLIEVMENEHIDLFIPGWEDAIVVSRHLDRFPAGKVFTSEFSLVSALHNKWEFSKLLTRLGFSTPATFSVKSKEDLENMPFSSFYLKSSYSRASVGTQLIKDKHNLPKIEFDKRSHLIAQETIHGDQYCTYSICHNGKVTAHATYPVHYHRYDRTKKRVDYCLSFEEVHHQKIYELVQDFAEKTGYTGSLAFDIFEEEDGSLKILECNPRLTSGITLLTQDKNLAEAFFNNNAEPFLPAEGTQVQYLVPSFFVMTIASIKNGSFIPFVKTLFRSKDLIFHRKDMKPFFFQPILFIYNYYLKFRHKKPFVAAYSHDFDYEGQSQE